MATEAARGTAMRGGAARPAGAAAGPARRTAPAKKANCHGACAGGRGPAGTVAGRWIFRERPGIAASPDGESGACGRDRGAAALRSGGGDADRFASNGFCVAAGGALRKGCPPPAWRHSRGAAGDGRRAPVSPTEEGISLCGVAGTCQHRKDLEPAPLPGER